MSIEGLGPILPPAAAQPVERIAPPPPSETSSEGTQTVNPPRGVDTDLWSVLTPDEQAYFAQQTLLGPLTYGPQSHNTGSAPPLGQRVDVRA